MSILYFYACIHTSSYFFSFLKLLWYIQDSFRKYYCPVFVSYLLFWFWVQNQCWPKPKSSPAAHWCSCKKMFVTECKLHGCIHVCVCISVWRIKNKIQNRGELFDPSTNAKGLCSMLDTHTDTDSHPSILCVHLICISASLGIWTKCCGATGNCWGCVKHSSQQFKKSKKRREQMVTASRSASPTGVPCKFPCLIRGVTRPSKLSKASDWSKESKEFSVHMLCCIYWPHTPPPSCLLLSYTFDSSPVDLLLNVHSNTKDWWRHIGQWWLHRLKRTNLF